MMENFKLKDGLYIGSTLVLILVMIGLTFAYLSSHRGLNGDTLNVHKSVSSSSESNESSSIDDVSKSSSSVSNTGSNVESSTSETSTSQTVPTSEQKTETSNSNDNQVSDTNNVQTSEPVYMEPSEFRYLYTAAGGDTLQTVFELTGVDVATLARVNNVSEDIILSAGQEIYVP